MNLSKSAIARASGCALVLVLSGGGCGLLSSDLASVNFDLPVRTYSFNTAQTGVTLPAAALPAVPCTASADCCNAATRLAPGIDCSLLVCDTNSQCAFTTAIETPSPQQMVDLKMDCPSLSSFKSQSVIDVTVNKITYDITANTLNVDLPAIELYVAAQGATNTSDPSAKRFGVVPPTTAGSMPVGGRVELDPEGQNAFKAFAHSFGTPFVFMARTTVTVGAGSPIPMGGISLTIKGQLKANAGL